MRRALVAVLAVFLLGAGEARSTQGPEIPGNAIRIIVPFSAGGPTDVLARVVGKILGEKLGVTTYIENKPGASGIKVRSRWYALPLTARSFSSRQRITS